MVEADEYDRSFLKLSPDIAIISAMDADHLDIYGTEDAMQDAFIEFSGKLKPGGLLLSRFGIKRGSELKADDHKTYSVQNDSADIYGANIRLRDGSYEFDMMMKDSMIDNVILNMGGMHNVENSIAAMAVARRLEIEPAKIKAAVADFKGVKRRFEYIIKEEGLVYIDDYAHHPEELRALIEGAKGLFPDLHCTVIFQPHLFTRTRDFVDGFAEVLSIPDETFLLPIYPAREKPIEGVNSQMIIDRMPKGKGTLAEKGEILDIITNRKSYNRDIELIITAGAGDIDTLVQPLKEILA